MLFFSNCILNTERICKTWNDVDVLKICFKNKFTDFERSICHFKDWKIDKYKKRKRNLLQPYKQKPSTVTCWWRCGWAFILKRFSPYSWDHIALKNCIWVLAGVAQWIECWPVNQKVMVRFPVRAHAWVAGQVPSRGHARGNHPLMFLCLSFSLSSPL